MPQVVKAWGEAYVAAERAAVAEGQYWAVAPPADPTLPLICTPAMIGVTLLSNVAISVGLGNQNWLPWVWTFMEAHIGPDARSARFSDRKPLRPA